MKYLLLATALLSANAFSEEIVVVQDAKRDYYALVTSCQLDSAVRSVRVKDKDAKVGNEVLLKTRTRTQKCEIKKVVKIT